MKVSRGTTAPISRDLFFDILCRTLDISPATWYNAPFSMALAISGGVDSMALAYLCKEAERLRPDMIKCKAFVVDHQVRPSSTSEACRVAARLRRMGISTNVLQLDNSKPAESQLETILRKKRFRALGHACRHLRIGKLLLAHHADDQAETVLMRMINRQTGDGLAGIFPSGNIPECYGLFGVHRSSETDENYNLIPAPKPGPLPDWLVKSQARAEALRLKKMAEPQPPATNPPFPFSPALTEPGVKVYRPLLSLAKSDLIQTCNEAEVSWVEDDTNRDRSLTLRNAVRFLLDKHVSPAALSKARLLEISQKTQARTVGRVAEFTKLTGGAGWGSPVDTRSGVLRATLYRGEGVNNASTDVLALALKHLADPATPYENPPLSAFYEPARRLQDSYMRVPACAAFERSQTEFRNMLDQFTAAGLAWKIFHVAQFDSERSIELVLTRLPFKLGEEPPLCVWNPQTSSHEHKCIQKRNGEWHLWDGRFWIKVWRRDNKPVLLRAAQATDWKIMFNGMTPRFAREYKASFKDSCPDKVRFTLPVLVDDETKQLLSLPSFGWLHDPANEDMTVDVRYKRGFETYEARS